MAGWGICIGFIGGFALVGIALAASRKAARSIDVTFGDVPFVHPKLREESRAAGESSGGWGRKARRLGTHNGGPLRSDRLGVL